MNYIRPPHLTASFLPDGRLLVKDVTLGIAAKVPPFTATLFSLCSSPQNRESIKNKLSEQGAQIFDQLITNGLLIPADQTTKEQIFDNFAHISVHRTMLHDEQRLTIYKSALRATVTPKSIVIDAGSGTGVLAVYAALAGAKHVYAIENSDLHAYIHNVARDSGVADRITVINQNFAEVRLPNKADILVTETFGAWALAEGAAPDLKQCIDQNLTTSGVLLPSHVDLWMAPLPTGICVVPSTPFSGDCQDDRSASSPHMTEDCSNGIDDDCDGYIDEDDRDCQMDFQENCIDLKDNDEDGLIDCLDPDCMGTLSCGSATRIASGIVQRRLYPAPASDCTSSICTEYPQGYCTLRVEVQGEARTPIEAQNYETCSFDLLLEYKSAAANCSALEKTQNVLSSSCIETIDSIPDILNANEFGDAHHFVGYDFLNVYSVMEKFEDDAYLWTGKVLPQPTK